MYVPYYDESGARVGAGLKKWIHDLDLCHKSCLILAVMNQMLLVYLRGSDQVPKDVSDFVGGHEDDEDRCPFCCGWREGGEELELRRGEDLVALRPTWFHAIGTPFLHDAPHNRETTQLFGVEIPNDVTVIVKDIGKDGKERIRESNWFSLDQLEADFAANPSRYADGIARVLLRLKKDESFRAEILHFVNSTRQGGE